MPWPAIQNIGLERPIRLEAGKKYHIQMILDDTIATIYAVSYTHLDVYKRQDDGRREGAYGEGKQSGAGVRAAFLRRILL